MIIAFLFGTAVGAVSTILFLLCANSPMLYPDDDNN